MTQFDPKMQDVTPLEALRVFAENLLQVHEGRDLKTARAIIHNVLSVPTKKTYIISSDEYMGIDYGMEEFKGTWRQLLEKLNNITDENRDDVFWVPKHPGVFDNEGEEKTVAELTDDDLIGTFKHANGDGQPYYMVWCVEEGKQVLG